MNGECSYRILDRINNTEPAETLDALLQIRYPMLQGVGGVEGVSVVCI